MGYAYIGGIQRFSTEDGPGIRTNVFFKGCPLNCAWCHNPELLDPGYGVLYREKDCIKCGRCVKACIKGAISVKKVETEEGQEIKIEVDRTKCDGCGACVKACPSTAMFTKSNEYTVEELVDEVRKDKDYYEMSGGGVTLSGGEVLMHADHAAEVGRAVKEAGFTVAIETSGFGKYEDLKMLADIADYILFDVKHTDPEKHRKFTGQTNELIFGNLAKLAEDEETKKKIIVRLPTIGGINDDDENMAGVRALMEKLGLKRVDILPYHNMGVGKAKQAGFDQETFETPDDEILEKHREMFLAAGMEPIVMGHED